MSIRHCVFRFDPSGSPIAAADGGTLHITIDKLKNFGRNDIYIKAVKASVRVLQAEFPTVVPIMGFFLSKGVIADTSSQTFPLWNNANTFYQPNTFYHHLFSKLPSENAEPMYFDDYLVEFSDNLVASLTIDNQNSGSYSTVIRVHATIEYEKIQE